MATLQIPIPDTIVATLADAIATHLGDELPTTNPQRIAVAQKFFYRAARRVLLDYLQHEAAQEVRDNPPPEVVEW